LKEKGQGLINLVKKDLSDELKENKYDDIISKDILEHIT